MVSTAQVVPKERPADFEGVVKMLDPRRCSIPDNRLMKMNNRKNRRPLAA
jgi:hypothetical protein